MSEIDWRGPVNQLLHGLMYDQQLGDAAVERIAQAVLGRRALRLGPEVYYMAASAARATGADLSAAGSGRHGHAELVDFLGRLLARLDELRPWPEPTFVKVSAAQWATFASAVPVARLDTSVNQLRDLIGEQFDAVVAGEGPQVLILRLATGETVGLLGAHGPGQRVTLLQRDPGDASTVRRHFQQATGFSAEKINEL